MAERNRVTPFGDIVAIAQRGTFLGNRGSIHRGHDIVRRWQVRRWITCTLTYKDWVAPKWETGRWTPLFFWDEAVALASGHRPCALCRRADFRRWMDGWEACTGERPLVDVVDSQLHDERTAATSTRCHRLPWSTVPDGTFVVVDDVPLVVVDDRLLPWQPTVDGYGRPRRRPLAGHALALTPPSTTRVLQAGYEVALHPTASSDDCETRGDAIPASDHDT
jgi:hypothetical protein